MSGIAGVISLKKEKKISKEDFALFFKPIMINKCKEEVIDHLDGFSIIGIGELEGFTPKYFSDNHNALKLFLWGDVFIRGNKNNLSGEEKFIKIIELWTKYDTHLTKHIFGFFNIVICDFNKNRYAIFNCKFGMLPLYYAIKGDTLLFSSRLQSFINSGFHKNHINNTSVLQYLIFNYQVNNDTFLDGVYNLPSASLISNDKNNWRIEKYDNHMWLFEGSSLNETEGKETVNQALREAIKRIVSLNNSCGCSITGGGDGRLVLSYLIDLKVPSLILYTYGKINHPDMLIAKKIAREMNIDHIPVFLDNNFINVYENLASESLLLSGGLRAANRSHYILMARKLSERTSYLISGNCGSNILKIIQSPSPVYNQYVIRLFQGTDIEITVQKIYEDFYFKHPWVKKFVNLDTFIQSVLASEIIFDKNVPPAKRLYHYLITNIERKYFGVEALAYSSYVYNYSPFIDTEFIKTIVKTPFFGGHYPLLEKSPLVRYRLSKLYADLIKNNSSLLAGIVSDRGFPVSWISTWYGSLAGYAVKKSGNYFKKLDNDPFNHYAGLKVISRKWKLEDDFFYKKDFMKMEDIEINALSWSYWFNNYFL